MLEVAVLNVKDEVTSVKFHTTVVEIMDGSLIVLREDRATFMAGFAPGRWLNFQVVNASGEH